MAAVSLDALPHVVRPAAGEADGALVLIHGRGASEHDLVALADVLDPARRLVALFPGGPLALPPGGRHWYVVRQVGFPDPATFGPTFELLSGWLDAALAALGVPIGRTVIGGFSQGCVMSYALGLGAGRLAPAGILGLSGFVPTVEGWQPDLAGRQGLPVAIAHGTYDPVIEVSFGRQARDLLTAGGLDVVYEESPLDHQVDPAVLARFAGWLRAAIERGGGGA